MSEIKSPEVMHAHEVTEVACEKCDGCGKDFMDSQSVLVVDDTICICLSCVEWAQPQMVDLESK